MTQAEFIPLAERYKDTVYRIALNYYGSPYDADDTVQDVMLKLFQREESFANENHARWSSRLRSKARSTGRSCPCPSGTGRRCTCSTMRS